MLVDGSHGFTCLGRLVRALASPPSPFTFDWAGVLDDLPIHPSVAAGIRVVGEPLSARGQAHLAELNAIDDLMKDRVRLAQRLG